ncbi:MAG: C1 family peptidase [Bryobacteraceae bacterium]
MQKPKSARSAPPKRNVVPDKLDLRDRPYMPAVAVLPPPSLKPSIKLPVMNQGETSACTGFALASVVHHLLRQRAAGAAAVPPVSPFMLYSMARRYDEFPGSAEDTGSSLRGAMKGWYKHGVCRQDLWKTIEMPPAASVPHEDWWLDAANRPLGAYYRVDTRSVTDMHVALNEVGILYVSAVCHDGWMKGAGAEAPRGDYWTIPQEPVSPEEGGHAFVIVGYDSRGFIIQNSWGTVWGSGGLARLTYEDWIENAMDCWVAQLGVVTEQHKQIAASLSLRVEAGRVLVSSDAVLQAREISPFVINMENNGRLSSSGSFRTQPGDLDALVTIHMKAASKNWGLRPSDPVDVAIYAHGGLTDEDAAARTASRWIPALYEAKILPIFFMWETDLWSTLKNRFEDIVSGLPRPAGGLIDQLKRFWNRRLERALAPAGSAVWGEMKQNAQSISQSESSGGVLLYKSASHSPYFKPHRVRLHLIGHSAGSIVHSYLIQELTARGWRFETVNFLAAAVTVDAFKATALKSVKDGAVRRLNCFQLSDAAEQQDPTCKALFGYGRSLLYLVSESFENGVRTPILGMEKYSSGLLDLPNVRVFSSPGPASASTTHGGFDDDFKTVRSVISLIKTGQLPA